MLLELERQDDDVFAWAKRHVTFMPLADEIQAATEILAKFPQLVNWANACKAGWLPERASR